MASLKVWHFFKNPLDLNDAWVTIGYYSYSEGSVDVGFTNWGLPDVSILELAPTEYIVGLKVRYRETKTAEWQSLVKNIRYNSEMSELQNIIVFMTTMPGGDAYTSAHAAGNLTVSSNYNTNMWGIVLRVTAYFPGDVVQYPQRSSVFEANNIAVQGVNIYY